MDTLNNTITVSSLANTSSGPTAALNLGVRAVHTQAGWLGQVLIGPAIVYETGTHDEATDALNEARDETTDVFTALFTGHNR